MPTIKQFLLPDPAEGLTEAEIVTWKIAVGDDVVVNQPIVDVETAKSLVELPCPYAGRVVEIHVPEGTVALVGSPIVSIDVDPDGAPAPGSAPSGDAQSPGVQSSPAHSAGENGEDGGRQPMLVGYGPKAGTGQRRRRRAYPHAFGPGSELATSVSPVLQEAFSAERPVATPVAPPRPPKPVTPVHGTSTGLPSAGVVVPPTLPPEVRVRTKPPVRRLARDLGVDLTTVTPGPSGLITREDVEQAAAAGQPVQSPVGGHQQPGSQPGAEREERLPITGVRRLTAEAMVASAFTAPHVTEWVSVDVTETMRFVDTLRARKDFKGVKVTPLALVAKALCLAVRRNPGINASWDGDAQEIVLKHYVNLGIAAATPRGLMVPNIPDAHALDVLGLAQALTELTDTAREGKTVPAAMRGGTITITNVGVFGVDGGTPILNPGEAAILAMGQVRPMPWVVDGEIAVRQVMQLSLSFDHRLVDGDLGSRVLADVAAVLENPALGLAWG